MALFNSCYAPTEEGGEENVQCGAGLVGIGALEPLVNELKKSLLSASETVIKKLRKRQVGRGKKRKIGVIKKKRQTGAGKKRQTGAGRNRQTGAGKKTGRKKKQTGAGRKTGKRKSR